MPKDVYHETNIDITYKPIVPGTIGENLYNYACFSVKKAKARK
jgi:hypothetical protein